MTLQRNRFTAWSEMNLLPVEADIKVLVKWTQKVLKKSDTEAFINSDYNCPNQNDMMAVNCFYLLNVWPTFNTIIPYVKGAYFF